MRYCEKKIGRVLAASFVSSIMPLWAADSAVLATSESAAATTSVTSPQLRSEIEQLKQMLADQQRQINELRQTLAQQLKKETGDDSVSASAGPAPGNFPNLGQVASTGGV